MKASGFHSGTEAGVFVVKQCKVVSRLFMKVQIVSFQVIRHTLKSENN